jgi:hypothetical protein
VRRLLSLVFLLFVTLAAVISLPESSRWGGHWTVHATTLTATTCNVSDVQAKVTLAADGDTVIIPNGSCSWASGITTAKQIAIQGATVGGVIITDTDTNTSDSLLTMTTGNSFHVTIANLRFLPVSPGVPQGNYISINGSGSQVFLMHDVYYNLPNFQLQHAVALNTIGGVIWNTTFESTNNISGACGTQVGSDSGSIVVKSPLSWDTPSTMGMLDTNGDKNLYIEDSTFSYVGQIPDVDDNGRVVLRHVTISNTSGGLTHGTTSSTGGRQMEYYNNVFAYTNTNRNVNRYFWSRGGTAIITANSVQAQSGQCYGNKSSWTFTVENAARSSAHGCATAYMGYHQSGAGASATPQSPIMVGAGQTPLDAFQISDPVYIWNNTGTGQGLLSLNDGDPRGCTSINPATGQFYTTSDFFKPGRDYFLNTLHLPASTARHLAGADYVCSLADRLSEPQHQHQHLDQRPVLKQRQRNTDLFEHRRFAERVC